MNKHEHTNENHEHCGHSHDHCECHSHEHSCTEAENIIPRLAVSAVLFVIAFVLSKIGGIPSIVPLITAAISYVVIGYDVVFRAVRNIFHGEVFDECFLMTLSSIGAFALGEYMEGAAVMLLYQFGEWLSDLAVDRSRDSISSLMNIRPDTAHLVNDGEETDIDPYDVKVGDILAVKAGERIPVDGIVTDGVSSLDTSSLTGESLPRDVKRGERVLSGSVNCDGVIYIRAEASAENSTAEKIMDLVENASENKSRSESFITRFAKKYTPAVVAIAFLIAVIPPLLFHGEWGKWITRGLVTLVISCPCALVISVPLTFFGGLGRASRSGILIKGGNYLEALANTEIAVFDKTGTLTRGSFTINELSAVNGDCDELLRLASAAESMSNHPIALSVVEEYERAGERVDKSAVSDVREIPGRGIKARAFGKEISVGNLAMMLEDGMKCEQIKSDGTVLYVSADGEYMGYIALEDAIKPDSKEGLEKLKSLGVKKNIMLTGDKKECAARVADELGIDEYKAELLPDGKLECFSEIKRGAEGAVVFVGDGINDAPVLATADIGVAMGGVGSDAAIEAADVVIMTDEISKLGEGIAIARKTKQLVIENIVFSLVIKLVLMILGAVGIANMWVAVIGDVGVMLLCVLNSLRVMRVD